MRRVGPLVVPLWCTLDTIHDIRRAADPAAGHLSRDDPVTIGVEKQVRIGTEDVGLADEQLARGCRFSDCAHSEDPDCAVLDAVAAGTLDTSRLEHYRRLLREAAFEERKRDKSAAAEEKRRWKRIHQAQKTLYRLRDR